jgi:hypothetical protein
MHSLTSALDGSEWSASRPGLFTPRERAPGAHWIGGWVGPRAVLDTVVKRSPSPHRESNPRTMIVQPIAQHYTKLSWLSTRLHLLNLPYTITTRILGWSNYTWCYKNTYVPSYSRISPPFMGTKVSLHVHKSLPLVPS